METTCRITHKLPFTFGAHFFFRGRKALKVELSKNTKEWAITADPEGKAFALRWLRSYERGEDFDDFERLQPFPPFYGRVFSEIQKISFGKTICYKTLALNVKEPKKVRVCARICGCNLLPLLIPCHRVIMSNGSIGGYSYGISIKKELIEYEKLFELN
jgi:O-6-methylguanine DNA methyltransferase